MCGVVLSLGVHTDGEAVEHVAFGVGDPQLPLAVAEAQAVQVGRHAVGRGYRQHLQRLARHREHLVRVRVRVRVRGLA